MRTLLVSVRGITLCWYVLVRLSVGQQGESSRIFETVTTNYVKRARTVAIAFTAGSICWDAGVLNGVICTVFVPHNFCYLVH